MNYHKDRPYAEPTAAEVVEFLEAEWRMHGMLGADGEANRRSDFEFITKMRDLAGRLAVAWLGQNKLELAREPIVREFRPGLPNEDGPTWHRRDGKLYALPAPDLPKPR
jgi:hypothetical protein